MKLQQFAKLFSKNVTILSIASAFVLGAVGMTDIKDSLFDTSKWFIKTNDTEKSEFENIAAESGKADFEFAKPSEDPNSGDNQTVPSDDPAKDSESTIVTTSSESSESTTPTVTIDISDMTLPEMTVPTESTSETSETSDETTEATTENTKDSGESTKKTKNTKTTDDTTKAPDSGNTTSAPKETTSAPKETTKAPKETTTAPKETTTAPKETTTAPKETTKKASLGDTSGTYNDGMAKEVLALVNEQRAANGLAPLSWSNGLAKGAKSRATEIVVHWDHVRPDGSEWYEAPGCENAYGENLGKGYGSAAGVVDGWMNSPTHRANILKSEYKTLGVACYSCNGKYYWVQEFGY
ncbi:MAG: CAP domain-containing protein [Clostridiales bacterium]|nr:CAP domain-containing protein [Clostridiales bacterium]